MPWRLKILDLEHGETHSSLMPAHHAVAFARDMIAAGSRVIAMVPTEGKALNEDEVTELFAGPTASAT